MTLAEPTFDALGYPTDETLDTIRAWPIDKLTDCEALLLFVGRAWNWPSYFTRGARRSRPLPTLGLRRPWLVSTGGWSGNESLIGAMQDNDIFWMISWVSSRRGGHYEFETREDK